MEIIVEGTGMLKVSPNQIELNINFNLKRNTYEQVLNDGISMVENFVNTVLINNGFTKEDLKTRNFTIREDQKYDELSKNYIVDGFVFYQNAVLKFDYDLNKLGSLINNITKLSEIPAYNVNFNLKDKNVYISEALKLAYNDALKKAQVIANVSGKTLIDIIKIDFKSPDENLVSMTNLNKSVFYGDTSNTNKLVNTFSPEDIEVYEKLCCVWNAK